MKIKFLIIVILIGLYSCKDNRTSSLFKTYPEYYCNMEDISSNGESFLDNHFSDIKYNGANIRSKEKSHSGSYSIKLNNKQQFGLSITIPNIKHNDYYILSVWRYSEDALQRGFLVISIGEKELYKQQKYTIEKDSAGWEKLQIKIRIPPFIKTNKIKIYVWQPGENDVYFDDLRIEKVKNEPNLELASNSLKIYIDEDKYNKIINIRDIAMKKKILETNDQSWVKAMLFDKDEMFEVKLRLKGDWTDHLEGTKWSFRIKIKNDKAWRGMREFSIQDPKTRFFEYEWLGHKIMKNEDVLSPRYDFIPVYINNTYIGIYAYEEHFVKQMLESKQRREGTILKLDESAFWTVNKIGKNEQKWLKLPVFESSTVSAYKLEKTLKNASLRNYFLIAQNLLFQHKFCNSDVSELFDVDVVAKYFAIIDLTKMYHGMRWHNQRFYYNPITSKLEIIGYDGYTTIGVFEFVKRPIIGNFQANKIKNINPESRFNYSFFTDSLFLEKYVFYLTKFSDTTYLDNIFKDFDNQLNKIGEFLETDNPNYTFNEDFYYDNAQKIRTDLPKYIEKIKTGVYYDISFKDMPKNKIKHEMNPLLPTEFVEIYLEKKQNNLYSYKVINSMFYDIEIVGLKNKTKENVPFYNINNIKVENYNSDKNEIVFNMPYSANYIVFKVIGFNDEYTIPVNLWKSPTNDSPRQNLIKESKFPLNEYYNIVNDKIIFKTGATIINKNIIIPKNYKVVINAGTELDFVNNAIFISYSPIYILGKENEKVVIKSSDNTAQGFTILQASEKSIVEYANFSGFNTLNYYNWTLTGAVNFYESEVSINNTIFENNYCEDALNIIRSDFNVENCKFQNIYSDAFDSDFCTGILSHTSFNTIGNDAIDFSGSTVMISDCNIDKVGDKGISGGEKSTLTVENTTISNSKIAVASKDNSLVIINNSTIKSCYYGFVALQKKPEYHAAILKATNLEYSNLIKLHLIEKKSKLYFNNKLIIGYDKNTAKKFY